MREVTRGRRTPKTGERMVLTHDDRPRVAQHFDRLELLSGDRQQHEGDIELSGNEEIDEMLDVGVLPERSFDRGRLLEQPSKEPRQQRLRHALERADSQSRRALVARAVQIGASGAQTRVDHLRVVEQQLTLGGDRDLAGAAQPGDEPGADKPFECCDLPTDRRLAVTHARAGAAERTFLGDRLERGQVTELHAVPRAAVCLHRTFDGRIDPVLGSYLECRSSAGICAAQEGETAEEEEEISRRPHLCPVPAN